MTDTPEALRERLERLAAARGFLLPHHGALAAGAPDLHDAYLRMYNALTVAPRILDAHQRESVWLGILIAAREHVGTHHLELFREAGGSDAQAEAIVTLAGQAGTLAALRFAAESFPDHLPALDPAAGYERCTEALRGPLPQRLAHLVMLAVQAVQGDHAAIAHHLRAGYALGLPEDAMVEALSYVIWPRGVNAFLDACAVWHGLMQTGEVTPSARFAVWRDMPGQGAFETGHGKRVSGFVED